MDGSLPAVVQSVKRWSGPEAPQCAARRSEHGQRKRDLVVRRSSSRQRVSSHSGAAGVSSYCVRICAFARPERTLVPDWSLTSSSATGLILHRHSAVAEGLDYPPLSQRGGIGGACRAFGEEPNSLLEELTEVLTA